ncbi:MAG: transglutaminase family protein, partial [Burkholderiaceae bacterium]
MPIRVALHHRTSYRYDRLVSLSPHEVRLRPAPHARTPVLSYSVTVTPEQHFVNWQQDPYGNYVARYVFPERTRELSFTVDLVADMTVINPFDFFVEQYAQQTPWEYPPQLKDELAAYLKPEPAGPRLTDWLASRGKGLLAGSMPTSNFLVEINQRLAGDIRYLVRMEPGVQTPEQTLQLASGSCRDSTWLLVQILRHLGFATRFVSGYLIQLKADVKALDGPSGTEVDFTDLHAWAEVYIPGAGWIGLDPTSGLFAGEGHIPLACTALPSSAAPVTGMADPAEVEFEHEMKVVRLREDPRVTKPYTDEQWAAIDALGERVDAELLAGDVRLTQGGEPTFVSIDDMDGPEWNTRALGDRKRELAGDLFGRLRTRFAPGALVHHGQGKWYPGEPLPRWALTLLWRVDGQPVWRDPQWLAPDKVEKPVSPEAAARFAQRLAQALGLSPRFLIPAYDDPVVRVMAEQELPINVDPAQHDLNDPAQRTAFARLLEQRLGEVAGWVLPIKPQPPAEGGSSGRTTWRSSRWPLRRERLYLIDGDSPIGMRLPLASLPQALPDDMEPAFAPDPFAPLSLLPVAEAVAVDDPPQLEPAKRSNAAAAEAEADRMPDPREVIAFALCVEVRLGRLHVFLPPLDRIEDALALIAAIEACAAASAIPVRLEGYAPPRDPRVQLLSVTPDPGVIEVNIHPAATWRELGRNVCGLYEDARQSRLGTEKFMLDGRHTGTGGGNHVTLGGATPADSPMLRRPDLLKSLIGYWQNHPSLSYLFSGAFIGPTSQAPRVDEARDDALYELEIAFQQMDRALPDAKEAERPWLVDRLLRNLLVDLTGNTHRAEFSIDKLYSPDSPMGRLGLVEFRAFEMPPHPQMSLMQSLLLRTLVARFWKQPFRGRLIHWGTELHDRWMLPYYVARDIRDVARDLRQAGYPFDAGWFDAFVEFRFPRHGTVSYDGVEIELRQAIEPWHVLGEEVTRAGTSRYVDSSVERLQVLVRGMTQTRHTVTCNGRVLPLQPTGVPGEYVAGVRFRPWAPWPGLHPTMGAPAPLQFDLIDTWSARALGGCQYHVAHPGGRNYDTFPVNANEAEARRRARFWTHGHSPGSLDIRPEPPNPRFPATLDLRWMTLPAA